MLTTDYKILAKILATRIKSVLPGIISEHQTGFMQGRQISTTIRTSIDIANLKHKKVQGYLLSLDFEKCFDKIDYSAITGSLRFFGFGDQFIALTELLLNFFKSCTINNGHLSDWFPVSRSCHQGCRVAPYYYLVCGQVLSQMITSLSGIHGIKIGTLEKLIAQFADDTQLFADTKNPWKIL